MKKIICFALSIVSFCPLFAAATRRVNPGSFLTKGGCLNMGRVIMRRNEGVIANIPSYQSKGTPHRSEVKALFKSKEAMALFIQKALAQREAARKAAIQAARRAERDAEAAAERGVRGGKRRRNKENTDPGADEEVSLLAMWDLSCDPQLVVDSNGDVTMEREHRL